MKKIKASGIILLGFLIVLAAAFVPSASDTIHAASLSAPIIDPSRATDWSTAGVVGGIPSPTWPNCTTSACNTLFGGTVTATSIENALASAPDNSVVRIPAGTFTLSSGFTHSRSNVVLRGGGSASTKLVINGTVTGSGLGLPRGINLISGAAGVGCGTSCGGTNPSQNANWTAGFAQGANVITLSNTTGLTAGPIGVGSLIFLDQLNDASDGYPATGDLYVCENGTPCSNQGGNNYGRPGRAQVQVVTVTAINGNQVTISPGLAMPNWRASQSPGAWWNSGSPLHNSGIEDLTVDFTGGGGSGIFVKDAANCWVTGTRWIKTDSGTSEAYHIVSTQSAHLAIRSNYLYGRPGGTTGNFPLANYPYTDTLVSDVALENNIFHHNIGQIIPNDPGSGNVYSYNYVDDGYLGVAGVQLHSGTLMMDLFEGNNMETFMGDKIHGPHYFVTLFRNHFDGETHNHSQTTSYAIGLNSHNRFFNIIGNVLGANSYSGYEQLLTLTSPYSPVYTLGWQGNASGGTVANDPDVARTVMRWGNWDSVSNATRWEASEVPSGIANYANPVPANHTLPASFYLSAQPSWWGTPWGTPPWPAIGPDVTSGNISSSPTGGHAWKIPARLCFENSATDPAYPTSNPRIRLFNANTCYGGTGGDIAPPSIPKNLRIQ
jgi:hypothetical protein